MAVRRRPRPRLTARQDREQARPGSPVGPDLLPLLVFASGCPTGQACGRPGLAQPWSSRTQASWVRAAVLSGSTGLRTTLVDPARYRAATAVRTCSGGAGEGQFGHPLLRHGRGELLRPRALLAVAREVVGERHRADVGCPVRLPDRRQARPRTFHGGIRVVVDHGDVVADHLAPAGTCGVRAQVAEGSGEVRGRRRLGQQYSVSGLPRDSEGSGPPHAEYDGRDHVGALADDDAFGPHVPAVHGARLAAQQRTHRGGVLLDEGERAGRPGADLTHPLRHSVSDARDQPARKQLGKGGQFHRRERRVAGAGGHDADADGDAVRGGQQRARLGDAATEAEVLHHPQLAEAELLRPARERQDLGDGQVARKHDSHPPTGRRCGLRSHQNPFLRGQHG